MAHGRRSPQASALSALETGALLLPRRLWRPILGLILGLVLLALAARGADLEEIWAGIRQADPRWAGAALVAVLLTTAAKVARWRGLFPSHHRPPLSSLGRALLVGQLVNALLPARLGDVARFYLLGCDEDMSKATVLGTVAAEKAFDVLFLLLTAGLAATLTSLPPWLHSALGAVAVLGGLVVAAAVALPRRPVRRLGDRAAARLPEPIAQSLSRLLQRAVLGLQSLRCPGLAARACAWSAIIWALAAATNLALFRAFALPLFVGPALFLLTLLHVGLVPPSSPGRLGVFHAITVVSLSTFGVGRSTSLAYAAVLHALVYGPQLLFGALALVLPRRMEDVR